MHIRRPLVWALAGAVVAVPAVVLATVADATGNHASSDSLSGAPVTIGSPIPVTGAAEYTIPTVSSAASNLANGLSVSANIGGGANKSLEIDTGSLGLVVARTALGSGAVDTGKAGYIEYTSSGKILSGEYFTAVVSFQRPQGAVATVPIRVLGVTGSSCAAGYPACKPDTDISGVGMLGVGYSEYAKTDSPGPTAADNAFLQLAAMHSGQVRPAFIVTRGSVTLGVTAKNLATFHTTALTMAPPPSGSGTDIRSMPGCFAFPDHGDITHCGTVLFDTGIARMIVGLPTAQRPTSIANAIPDGTRIKVGIANLTDPTFGYTTSVGDPSDPIAPLGNPAATWSHDTAFINTGRELLAAYDYVYDSVGQQAGFRSDPNG